MGGLGDEVPDRVEVFTPGITDASDIPLSEEIVQVYPNPIIDQLTIVNRNSSDGCLTLVQADGRVIAKLHLQSQNQQQVSVAVMPPGLLLWKWMPDCKGVMQAGTLLVIK